MKDKTSVFIRKYQRASKSPWDDKTTILLYAAVEEDNGEIKLDFSEYIYMHRDEIGRVLGISISKTLLAENPEFAYQYLSEIEMFAFLLIYIDKITEFCCLFTDEFERLFLIDPISYFEKSEIYWLAMLDKAFIE